MEKLIVLVDEHDTPTGTTDKITAHEQGLLHRAFSVFIFNDAGELLIQRRHPNKYHCGGLWTNTCCSHPYPDENILKAGERRLQEELGFTVPLTHCGEFIYHAPFDNGLTEHEYDHVLIGRHNGDATQYNQEEISAVRWISIADLDQEMQQYPEHFTPWFPLALEHIPTIR